MLNSSKSNELCVTKIDSVFHQSNFYKVHRCEMFLGCTIPVLVQIKLLLQSLDNFFTNKICAFLDSMLSKTFYKLGFK